jgi:hypothetical protein
LLEKLILTGLIIFLDPGTLFQVFPLAACTICAFSLFSVTAPNVRPAVVSWWRQAVCGTAVAITFLIVEIAAWPYAANQDNYLKAVHNHPWPPHRRKIQTNTESKTPSHAGCGTPTRRHAFDKHCPPGLPSRSMVVLPQFLGYLVAPCVVLFF